MFYGADGVDGHGHGQGQAHGRVHGNGYGQDRGQSKGQGQGHGYGYGYGRVPRERVLEQAGFGWPAPGSSECKSQMHRGMSMAERDADMNLGLELIGNSMALPAGSGGDERQTEGSRHGSRHGNLGPALATVGLDGNVPGARNADTWASDLQHDAATSNSRLPDPGEDYARALGQPAHGPTLQLPGTA
jgi:hypothetical protein